MLSKQSVSTRSNQQKFRCTGTLSRGLLGIQGVYYWRCLVIQESIWVGSYYSGQIGPGPGVCFTNQHISSDICPSMSHLRALLSKMWKKGGISLCIFYSWISGSKRVVNWSLAQRAYRCLVVWSQPSNYYCLLFPCNEGANSLLITSLE